MDGPLEIAPVNGQVDKHLDGSLDEDLEEQKEQQQSVLHTPTLLPQQPDDPDIIVFDGPNDQLNPQNSPVWLKWVYAVLLGLITFVATFASSVFSTATEVTAREFGVSQEVMTLGTALFVLGYAAGPIVFGPLSELYGRKNPLFFGYAIFLVFQIPVAVARNLPTIFICRFLSGVGGAAPPAIVGGYLADFFDPVRRGFAVTFFSAASFLGPLVGPILGGFITQSYLGWRWTAWITLIMSAAFGAVAFIVLPETYTPVILRRKARALRFETRNWALHAKIEESRVDLRAVFAKYLSRPFIMTALEPILLLFNLYMSFVYGIIYLLFEAYPVSFLEERGYNLGVSALPFISIGIGVILGSCYIVWYNHTTIRLKFNKDGKITPEDRLVPMIIGGALLPVGCFWFGWTSPPDISPWPQIVAGVPIGAGLQLIFLQGLTYLIDVYLVNANSAISANVFGRSWFGAGFTMFAAPMYHKLGVNWATSLLGFLSIAFFPVPALFYVYGAKIRNLSKYSPTS